MSENDYESFKEKGNEYFKLKNYDEAQKFYTKAINSKKDEPIVYSNRAICYINLRKFFEAIEDCDTAIKLNPTIVKAYYRRALASKSLYRYREALEDFQQVLKLDATLSKLVDEQIKSIEQILKEDNRIDLIACDKPDVYRSDQQLKKFELKNHYSGQKEYFKS